MTGFEYVMIFAVLPGALLVSIGVGATEHDVHTVYRDTWVCICGRGWRALECELSTHICRRCGRDTAEKFPAVLRGPPWNRTARVAVHEAEKYLELVGRGDE